MNQIKYILSACLILLMVFMGIFLYKTFPESGIVANNPIAIPKQKATLSRSQELSSNEIRGKALFRKNCRACHAIEGTDNFLAGFENRGPWKNRRELYKWIKNPEDYILHDFSGYTLGLKEKYGVSMSPSPNLSDRDIDNIIDYLIKANND
jgi:mono/diheme cytochrome c family protein